MHFLRGLAAACVLASITYAQTWNVGSLGVAGVTAVTGATGGGNVLLVAFDGSGNGPTTTASLDGVLWSTLSLAYPRGGSLEFSNGYYFLAGSNVILRALTPGAWQTVYTAGANESLRGIATDGRSLLVGSAKIDGRTLLYSPDGLTWRQTDPFPDTQTTGTMIGDIVHGAGVYLVTYYTTNPDLSLTPRAASTTDGKSWTRVAGLPAFMSMAAGNGRLVTMYGGKVYISTDGLSFASYPQTNQAVSGTKLFFAGGRFIDGASLYGSVDGRNWAAFGVGAPVNQQPTIAAFGNGVYIVGGASPGGGSWVASLRTQEETYPAAPRISEQPISQSLVAGKRLELSFSPSAYPGQTFQWSKDGVPIPGATGTTYSISEARFSDTGRYVAQIITSLGITLSEPANVRIVPPEQAGRIANVSVLTTIDATTPTLILGFTVSGNSAKPLLVRAAGPSLSAFGVTAPNPDPTIELFAQSTSVSTNNDWAGAAEITAHGDSVGAFPFLSSASKDAALYAAAQPGTNSAVVRGNGGAAGPVLVELYDTTPSGAQTPSTPRLVNASVRHTVPAATLLTVGFAIVGETPRQLLIRAIGPSLAPYGITDAMPDPVLGVIPQGASSYTATNGNWSGNTAIATASTAVHAFGLSPSSKDAAILVTLEPGVYSAQVGPTNGSAGGTVLVEIYEVP